MPSIQRRVVRHLCLLALGAGLVASVGCGGGVRQKVVVYSEPAGADVTMNDVHLGRTPVEVPFTWYWWYDFKAEKEGFETTVVRKRFYAPVHQWTGLDFLTEFYPGHIKDTREVTILMEPADTTPGAEYDLR